jgi:isoquinoline 1-oxidoreductase subunit beta
MTVTRRAFLQTSARTGAGLVLGFQLAEFLSPAASGPASFEPNAYLRVTPDNTVTLWVTRSEMGQGVRTSLAAVLAEELEVDLATVQLQQAMPGARFQGISLRTSGSSSVPETFLALRRAGATAREMLVAAAAETWGVERASCHAQLGTVVHLPSGRRLRYGQLASRAARQVAPREAPLKDMKDFRLIGTRLLRVDGAAIVRGAATYGFDVRVPGMLVAVMQRCPLLGGKVVSFDGAKALAVPGVRRIVPIKSGIATGVAVVADTTWAALRGRDALTVEWDAGPNSSFDSDRFIQALEAALAQDGYPIRREGDPDRLLAGATRRVEALYTYPFQAHAPLEPMNCVASVRADGCDVWVGTQAPETAHADVTRMLGLPSEAIQIHTTLLGGGFGRRLFVDYVHEAVELSQAVGQPVHLIWTRADDMRHGFFHPASIEQVRAGLDGEGRAAVWLHKSVGSDLSMFGLPSEQDKKDVQRYARDESPWGAFDNPYSFPSMRVDYVPVDSPVPSGSWRAVDYPSRVYARESFIDEIAAALGKDPLQFRVELLQPGDILKLGGQRIDRRRMIRVLEVAREKAGWERPVGVRGGGGRVWGRGLAINVYHAGSYVAQVAEVSVAHDLSDLRVQRIVCVLDCGLVINLAGLEGQVESGITWGLSAALHGKIDFRNGRVVQGTYADFPVMRINEMPSIETYVVPSNAPPSGFGEHPVPPVAPAVANAVFAATGQRVRSLPITPASLHPGAAANG